MLVCIALVFGIVGDVGVGVVVDGGICGVYIDIGVGVVVIVCGVYVAGVYVDVVGDDCYCVADVVVSDDGAVVAGVCVVAVYVGVDDGVDVGVCGAVVVVVFD